MLAVGEAPLMLIHTFNEHKDDFLKRGAASLVTGSPTCRNKKK
jgi:hypothetical protein